MRGAGYANLRTQLIRVTPLPTSVTASNVDSHAKRISPPATIDCSGSHSRTVAFTESVLMPASV